MSFNTQLLQRGLTVSPLYIRLHAHHSSRHRQRLCAALKRALLAKGYLLAHKCGMALVMPMAHQSLRQARHATVNWLVDQTEVCQVVLHDPVPLRSLLDLQADLVDEQDAPLMFETAPLPHLFMMRLAQGLLMHAAVIWQATNASQSPTHIAGLQGQVQDQIQGGSDAAA